MPRVGERYYGGISRWRENPDKPLFPAKLLRKEYYPLPQLYKLSNADYRRLCFPFAHDNHHFIYWFLCIPGTYEHAVKWCEKEGMEYMIWDKLAWNSTITHGSSKSHGFIVHGNKGQMYDFVDDFEDEINNVWVADMFTPESIMKHWNKKHASSQA